MHSHFFVNGQSALKANSEISVTCLMLMCNEGKGTIFRRKDDRYLLYLPISVADDSMFPLKCGSSMPVKVHFSAKDGKLTVEKWIEITSP